jgi:hypothetical protein
MITAEGVGMLVALLDTNHLEHRRLEAVQRLREVEASALCAYLPEELRQRVREIVAGATGSANLGERGS